LDLVAFDIETTGFTTDDEITVAGFALEMGARVFVQTNGQPAGAIEQEVRDAAAQHVQVSVHESESDLLEAMTAFVAGRLVERDVLLVAYNGETWGGGFDLPFLRTRLASHGLAWPFTDIPYGDLLPVITDRFNTTVPDPDADPAADPNPGANAADLDIDPGEQKDGINDDAAVEGCDDDSETVTRRGLAAVYEVLCDGRFGEIDPFADSAEAVTAFDEGRFTALVLHNVADILRTRALGRLAQRYCSKSDFSVKSLTAVHDAE
jgi:hypothetical protein